MNESATSEPSASSEWTPLVQLLQKVFPHAGFYSDEYLQWYYRDNPVGEAAIGQVAVEDVRAANYALVPQRFVAPGKPDLVLGIGVDLAVDPDFRGSGTFRRCVEDSYRRGQQLGYDGILGIANANSAPRMVSALGWRGLHPLPARLVPALGKTRGFRSWYFADEGIEPLSLSGTNNEFMRASSEDYAPLWTIDLLQWRLSRPTFRYAIHESDDVVVVSTRTTVAKVPVAPILKVFVKKPNVHIPLGRLAAVVGKFHRAPFAVYWGRNPAVGHHGVPLPERFMPSPLSLVLHSFGTFVPSDFELGEFEFLDFDSY